MFGGEYERAYLGGDFGGEVKSEGECEGEDGVKARVKVGERV